MHASLCVWLTLVELVLCNACDTFPIALPITDNILSNGKRRRGILGTLGTPPQNISFMVHTYLNDTWVYNSTAPLCGNTTSIPQCLTSRGGLYDTSNSSTYTSHPNVHSAGGDPSDVQRALGTHIWDNVFATDTLGLHDNTSLAEYPIGIPGYDFGGEYDRQANFGLGQNSTLLERLKSTAQIPSLSWSYWWGISNSASTSATPGQIVFGGYDAAKVDGEPFTQTLQPPSAACQSGMTLSFTNLILRFPNGTALDLNPSRVLTGCIQPDFPAVMSIPADPYFWKWMDVTQTMWMARSLGTYWFMPVFPPNNVWVNDPTRNFETGSLTISSYAGALDIQVQGGPVVSIPNDVLVVPDEYIDKSGTVRRNDSAAVLLLSPNDGPNVNDQLIIGMSFFSGAYLSVNHDNRTWSIWPAKATTVENIVAFGNGCGDVTKSNEGHNSNAAEEQDSKTSEATGMSMAAKIGIAVGAACAAVLLAILLTVLIMRKRRKSAEQKVIRPPVITSDRSSWSRDYYAKSGSAWALQEMAGSQRTPNELKGSRTPAELGSWSEDKWLWKSRDMPSGAVELPVLRN